MNFNSIRIVNIFSHPGTLFSSCGNSDYSVEFWFTVTLSFLGISWITQLPLLQILLNTQVWDMKARGDHVYSSMVGTDPVRETLARLGRTFPAGPLATSQLSAHDHTALFSTKSVRLRK